MDPRLDLLSDVTNFIDRVTRARVYIPKLRADDGWPCYLRNCLRNQSVLVVRRDYQDTIAAKADKRQGL
jgi:hypothetical protein